MSLSKESKGGKGGGKDREDPWKKVVTLHLSGMVENLRRIRLTRGEK